MKKYVCLVLVLLLTSVGLFAQQGEYQRKSVSSVGSVWFAAGANSSNFDHDFFSLLIKEYIEVARFDYNQLSGSSINAFRQRANALSSLDVPVITKLLRETVGQDVSRVLSDPEIQKARLEGFADESARIQLAQLKGKEYGLTEEQIGALMNSAYLYMPYVTKLELTQDGTDVSYSISGGILWYQVKVDTEGQVALELVESAENSGIGQSSTANPLFYGKFRLGKQTFSTNAYQYAMYSGMQAWVKNLAVVMKRIPDFSLSAQIVEALNSRKYSSTLGKREGVHLDDTFRIMEMYEDSEGVLKKKRVGYARLIRNVDNTAAENSDKLSVVKLHWGKGVMPGSILEEYPLLGLEVAIYAGSISGFNYPSNVFPSAGVTKDVTGGSGINFDFSFNLAPMIGISQSFWDIELGIGLPNVTDNVNDTSASLTSIYTGLSKRLWMGRNGLGVSARVGMDIFSSEMEVNSVDYGSSVSSFGARLGAKYIYMVSPNVQLTAGISKTFSTGPFAATMSVGDLSGDIPDSELNRLETGSTRITLGVNWLLKSFPYNLFGWLDTLKKY